MSDEDLGTIFGLSGRMAVTNTPQRITLGSFINRADRRGSLWNRGNKNVFIAWNKDTIDSLLTTETAINEEFLKPGQSMRVPFRTNYFMIACAGSDSSYISYVED